MIGLTFFILLPSQAGIFLVLLIIIGAAAFAWSVPKAISLAKGLSGEREVGAILDELKRGGAFVFHDIGADSFNIDHAVVSTRGIFAIETKYVTKRKSQNNKLSYHDGQLTIHGAPLKFDPLPQARGSAAELRRILKTFSIDRPVKPVVLYPGWWVEGRPNSNDQPWVLEPKALAGWISNEPSKLTPSEAAEIAGLLARYSSTFD